MAKIHFDTDYMSGAHPKVMERLMETNFDQTPGYGTDTYTAEAKELILEACGTPDARVFFLVGGTQTNSTVIDGVLARHEGVLCAESGHINVHESGAIEATGHKVLILPSYEGKVAAEDVSRYIEIFYSDETYEHMVAPGMLYISFPTEYGTIYSLKELQDISDVCHKAGIPLFIDGARLGYGLAADGGDVTLKDIARLSDVFYIGGTKVGALFGEAVVVTDPNLLKNFTPLVKQHGALLAKGRLLGVQFGALFTDGLYDTISKDCVGKAMRVRNIFTEKGYKVEVDSPTNQQFFRLPNDVIDRLKEDVSFELWGPRGETETVVRFVTGWTTTDNDIDTLESILNQKS
ncbi:MAG: low specificity L-threonine aldolase [Bacteroidales bacterium]|nr:low specificity L-threonine aldolase [Bacteroidales bacterium]